MEIKKPFVFQADSAIVNEVYEKNKNYLIEYNTSVPKKYCVLYFSSNNIYFPNDETVFTDEIIKKDRFEWYSTRIQKGYKNIFLRDIKKQWYLTGINGEINTPEKLLAFLQKETEGYSVIALGSSAGGFASVIFGQLLNAEQIYTFNGQFEILSLLQKSTEDIDPILFRNRDNKTLLPFYDTLNFINNPEPIFYFYSNKSQWDVEQNQYVSGKAINTLAFNTNHHGIPFFKSNLPFLLNTTPSKLKALSKKTHWPIIFSLNTVGIVETFKEGLYLARLTLKRMFAGKTKKN